MRIIAICTLFSLFATLLNAQATTSLSGVVTDLSGAVVPGATVTLVNDDTSAQRETRADKEGRYSFQQVQPGRYHLLAKAAGFSDVVVNDVRLLVSSPTHYATRLARAIEGVRDNDSAFRDAVAFQDRLAEDSLAPRKQGGGEGRGSGHEKPNVPQISRILLEVVGKALVHGGHAEKHGSAGLELADDILRTERHEHGAAAGDQ